MEARFWRSKSTSDRAPVGNAELSISGVIIKCVVWLDRNGTPYVKWPQEELKTPRVVDGRTYKYNNLVRFEDGVKEQAEAAVLTAAGFGNYAQRETRHDGIGQQNTQYSGDYGELPF